MLAFFSQPASTIHSEFVVRNSAIRNLEFFGSIPAILRCVSHYSCFALLCFVFCYFEAAAEASVGLVRVHHVSTVADEGGQLKQTTTTKKQFCKQCLFVSSILSGPERTESYCVLRVLFYKMWSWKQLHRHVVCTRQIALEAPSRPEWHIQQK